MANVPRLRITRSHRAPGISLPPPPPSDDTFDIAMHYLTFYEGEFARERKRAKRDAKPSSYVLPPRTA
jgi:hypothetical protein